MPLIGTGRTGKKRQPASGSLHVAIFDTLRSEILSGEYLPGSTLPAENALTKRFGVSRHTVRQALRHLKDHGLAEPQQGRGTVVLAPGAPQQYVYHLNNINDMHDQLVETRYDIATRLVTMEDDPEALAETPIGSRWCRVTGLRYPIGDVAPICEFEMFIAEQFDEVVSHIHRAPGPVYSLIETVCGERLDDVHQLVSAFTASERKGRRIALEDGATGVEIRRHFRTMSGELCMLSYNRYPADRFVISMKLSRVR